MTSLRFCFLTTFYPPYSFGGDAVVVERFARGLARAGHHVTVVHDIDAYRALSSDEPSARPAPVPGVEVVGLRSSIGALSAILTHQVGRPVMHGGRIAAILERGAFDVINFHNVSLIGGPGLLRYGSALKLYMAHEHWLVCPTHVLWRHGRELCTGRECVRCQLTYRRPPQVWRGTGFLERELAHVDTFIAMSEFSRQKHREFGFPRDMEVLPPLVPQAAGGGRAASGSESPHSRPYFLVASRLEAIKGVQDVIPVFANYPDADLLIAGDGDHAGPLRALAAGNDRVRFLGRVPTDGLAPYFRHAVAVIAPSRCYETFGVVLIEAFREGVPVIARGLGPFPEIVDAARAGVLFADPAGLLAAMRQLQASPAYRARLGENGRAEFERRWSENVVIPAYLDIVRRAAERKRGAAASN